MTLEAQLVKEYQPLVWKIVKRRGRMCPQIAWDDLFQEGCCGLLKAIRRFDPTRGSSLAWYAEICIQKAVTRFIELNSSVVKLSETHRKQLFYRLRSPEAPTYEDLAKEFNVSVDEVRKFASFTRSGDLSEGTSSDDSETFVPWSDYLIDARAAAEDVERSQLRAWVRIRAREFLSTLKGKESRLFVRRFLEEATLTEAAKELCVGNTTAFDMEERLLEKWRRFVGEVD